MTVDSNKTIRDVLNEINPRFFTILKKACELDITRTLQISTYLLNLNIAENYFPLMKAVLKTMHKVSPDEIPTRKLQIISKNMERLKDICVIFPLRYKNSSKNSEYLTDVRIDGLEDEVQLIEKFFFYNAFPKDSNIKEIDNLMKNYRTMVNLLPYLDFDPEFKQIKTHEAFNHMFPTFPGIIFSDLDKYMKMRYRIDDILLAEYEKICKDEERYKNFLFKIDPDLLISPHIIQLFNYGYVINLGCKQLVDDIGALFIHYYSKRIPSKASTIKNYINCYMALLKLTQGKLYQELKWRDVVKQLENSTSKEFGEKFLKEVCLEYTGEDFDPELINFNPTTFLEDYHEYMKIACNYHFGIVRIGAFTVWRSMLKFFEELHREPEFYKKKGALLENWCYKKAMNSGLNPEKFVLTNENKEPSNTYLLMKEQVKDWPKEILEFNLPFPEEYAKFYYQEIDLVIRIQDTLFIFECKGTSAPVGEEPKFLRWVNNFTENFESLKRKCKILSYLIKKDLIENSYLKGLKHYIPFQIQTEGIFLKNQALTLDEYLELLDDLKQYDQNKSINTFLEQFQGNIL